MQGTGGQGAHPHEGEGAVADRALSSLSPNLNYSTSTVTHNLHLKTLPQSQPFPLSQVQIERFCERLTAHRPRFYGRVSRGGLPGGTMRDLFHSINGDSEAIEMPALLEGAGEWRTSSPTERRATSSPGARRASQASAAGACSVSPDRTLVSH